jgi:hypothetical protein
MLLRGNRIVPSFPSFTVPDMTAEGRLGQYVATIPGLCTSSAQRIITISNY